MLNSSSIGSPLTPVLLQQQITVLLLDCLLLTMHYNITWPAWMVPDKSFCFCLLAFNFTAKKSWLF